MAVEDYPYSFNPLLAVDRTTLAVAKGATVTFHADPNSAPLELGDLSGDPIGTTLTTTPDGIIPAHRTTVAQPYINAGAGVMLRETAVELAAALPLAQAAAASAEQSARAAEAARAVAEGIGDTSAIAIAEAINQGGPARDAVDGRINQGSAVGGAIYNATTARDAVDSRIAALAGRVGLIVVDSGANPPDSTPEGTLYFERPATGNALIVREWVNAVTPLPPAVTEYSLLDGVALTEAGSDTVPYTLGTEFTVKQSGDIVGFRYYMPHIDYRGQAFDFAVWAEDGTVLAALNYTIPAGQAVGWMTIPLSSKVPAGPGVYRVGNHARVINGSSRFRTEYAVWQSRVIDTPAVAASGANGNAFFRYNSIEISRPTDPSATNNAYGIDVLFAVTSGGSAEPAPTVDVSAALIDTWGAHDLIPRGVPEGYSWREESTATSAGSTMFMDYGAVNLWGQIFVAEGYQPNTNVRFQIRNPKLWWWFGANEFVEAVQNPGNQGGAFYKGDYNQTATLPGGPRNDGSNTWSAPLNTLSGTTVDSWHWWWEGHTPRIPLPSNLQGIISFADVRLIPADGQASVGNIDGWIANLGVDLFATPETIVGGPDGNPGIPQPRMKRVTGEWQRMWITTLSAAQISAHPPTAVG